MYMYCRLLHKAWPSVYHTLECFEVYAKYCIIKSKVYLKQLMTFSSKHKPNAIHSVIKHTHLYMYIHVHVQPFSHLHLH